MQTVCDVIDVIVIYYAIMALFLPKALVIKRE